MMVNDGVCRCCKGSAAETGARRGPQPHRRGGEHPETEGQRLQAEDPQPQQHQGQSVMMVED